MRVGWIGLGSVGTEMAVRILAAGHELTAYSRGSGQDKVVAAGASLCPDYVALASDCEFLGVCVFNDTQLEEALLQSGALASLSNGSVLAIHTTGSPELTRALADHAPQGVEILDACFSGGPKEAASGELTLMIGGSKRGLDRATEVLSAYASHRFHVGAAGAGQTAKLLNNLLFATNLRFAAEIMKLGDGQGLETAQLAQVCQRSSGASMAMGMFQSGRSPDDVLLNVAKYMEKDVAAAKGAAASLDLDFSRFQPILDFFTKHEATVS